MPRSDRTTPLSVEAASELRDALRRRQKELPPRWLAAVDAAALRDADMPAPGHSFDATERELGVSLVANLMSDGRPRGLVCVRPSASAASIALVDVLCRSRSVTSIAATELDPTLATGMIEQIIARVEAVSSVALACDCTVELPLRAEFPRPRVYLCLGNVLGSTTTLGAVRLLRILRTTMRPGDSILLGLDVRRAERSSGQPMVDDVVPAGSRHLDALALVGTTTGADFDPDGFEYRPSYDAEQQRVETHLVARSAFSLDVPGVCDVRFRKGESIRTSVRCVFDRTRVSAMLGGVGLMLRYWTTDAASTYAVALAIPAVSV